MLKLNVIDDWQLHGAIVGHHSRMSVVLTIMQNMDRDNFAFYAFASVTS